MGHANLTNISKVVNRRLKNSTTITECVDELEATNQGVHASEGIIKERYMLAVMCEEVVSLLLDHDLIKPAKLSNEQKSILKTWRDPESDIFNWDCGDDGDSGEYGILDSIKWTTDRKRLPIIKYFTN